MLLVITNIAAVPFALTKEKGAWKRRSECVAIIVSFVIAASLMDWMYNTYGYVRLLGMSTAFGKYVHFYLVVAGLSLGIDLLDVVRYLLGDGELYLHWA
ncbi:MAG: hypothetical protein ACI80L_000627 [Pseudohongiellaceae bacterium]|jgi:hypothetical protein